jgi:hypothetical protein
MFNSKGTKKKHRRKEADQTNMSQGTTYNKFIIKELQIMCIPRILINNESPPPPDRPVTPTNYSTQQQKISSPPKANRTRDISNASIVVALLVGEEILVQEEQR